MFFEKAQFVGAAAEHGAAALRKRWMLCSTYMPISVWLIGALIVKTQWSCSKVGGPHTH